MSPTRSLLTVKRYFKAITMKFMYILPCLIKVNLKDMFKNVMSFIFRLRYAECLFKRNRFERLQTPAYTTLHMFELYDLFDLALVEDAKLSAKLRSHFIRMRTEKNIFFQDLWV